jgi:hypothetical protein
MYIYIYVYKLWCYFCCKKTAKRKHQSHKLKLMALILQKNVLYNCWLFWEISCPYKKLSCPYKKSSCPYKKSSCPYKKNSCPYTPGPLYKGLPCTRAFGRSWPVQAIGIAIGIAP